LGTVPARGFGEIREWEGSKDKAFEELCYQLRDPTPSGGRLKKTGDPDAGYEWYVTLSDGTEWGWQAKYSEKIDTLLGLMEGSLRTVCEKRPACTRLTFCVPFDLPDGKDPRGRKSAREKFEDRKASWPTRIPGADKVEIRLVGAGELLERLSGHPNQRGIEFFFWGRECFSPAWCEEQMRQTVDGAGERYTAPIHVDLPIALTLDGLAGSERFWADYSSLRDAVGRAAGPLRGNRHQDLGPTQLGALRDELDRWDAEVQDGVGSAGSLDREAALAATDRVINLAYSCYRALSAVEEADDRRAGEQVRSLEIHLGRLSESLDGFRALLEKPAARARETNALLLLGGAGQGKTHLFCDAGVRLAAAGHPALVMLGGRFRGPAPWRDVAGQLGLGDIGSEALIGAMAAAGEAAGKPFVLLIDALNESQDPRAWLEELPAMIAAMAASPWIAVGFSLRDSYRDLVVREEGIGACAEARHHGFEGREPEALESFFTYFELEPPRIPLVTPEFINPLFLKLYCEGLKGLGRPGAEMAHVSDVFAWYLEAKERSVCDRLKLDPRSGTLRSALGLLAGEMIVSGDERVPRARAAELLADLVPTRTEWPDTLLGALLAEGVLSGDVAWGRGADQPLDVVRLSYQRLGDHRIAEALLAPYSDSEALKSALSEDPDLRARVEEAPIGWVEALSVQVPERFGVELLEAGDWNLDSSVPGLWRKAFLAGIASRRPASIGPASVQLFEQIVREDPELADEALEGLISIAATPSHPLNAHYLHDRLARLSMPDRDASWSVQTYFALEEEGALDRLLRWATRGPHPGCPEEIAELVLVTIGWTLTSPNRRLRDHATKAMVMFVSSRLKVARRLVELFSEVDDAYVRERIAVIAHGAILCGGSARPEEARALGEAMRCAVLESSHPPGLVARDAVRGAHEWCRRMGLVDADALERVSPPYGASAPKEPRSEAELESLYCRRRTDQDGARIRSEYAAIFYSLFGMGDFGRYVVESRVRRFTEYPLADPFPTPTEESREEVEALWSEIEDGLGEEAAGRVEHEPLRLIEVLDDEQRELLAAATSPRLRRDPRSEYSGKKASCWIFERVLELGWTPERFDGWEMAYVRSSAGRSGHKPERFGKKYQWIALDEFSARLADNFHMAESLGRTALTYRGPWHFFGRDIDPTLPPAPRAPRGASDHFADTFQIERDDVWWSPGGPVFAASDEQAPDDWASQTDDIPSFESLVCRVDPAGRRWVALQAYLNWRDAEREEGVSASPRRRDLWSHIKSWLVRREDREANLAYLKGKSFMNHWMPQGGDITDAAYLAEMPWSASANEYPSAWSPLEGPMGEVAPDGLELYPAWIEYMWEGSVSDCSIDSSARAVMPADLLFEAGSLRWRPGRTEWADAEDRVVAYHRANEAHSNLLVDERWLAEVLEKNGWSLIVGWLGEKQLFSSSRFSPELVGEWTEFNGVAVFEAGEWRFHGPRLDRHTPAR
jgi:hypothetical protein